MRIGIIVGPFMPVPPSKYGGTEQVIYHLIKGLKEEGHRPVLFAPGDSTVDCEVVPIVDRAIPFPPHQKDVPQYRRLQRQVNNKTVRLLRTELSNLDIIHSHGFDLRQFKDSPNLTTLHCRIELEDLPYYTRRQNLYYVSISQNQQDFCPGLQYVSVVYNGEDPEQFPIVDKPEDYLCFLGRFESDKNPHLAIELAISLGMKIKIAGKVDYHGQQYFEEKIKPYLTYPLVEYLGELGFEDKIELISKAKCNLHPTSFREPFGLTVMESAYCGTPTMAIARGSMSELIEEGRTGMLVEDFVKGFHPIKKCFEMDRRYIASRSRLLFNYKTMTKEYLKAYEYVIAAFEARRVQDRV
jgi:glycosyltransferase involved in cell wall biosynthesis